MTILKINRSTKSTFFSKTNERIKEMQKDIDALKEQD